YLLDHSRGVGRLQDEARGTRGGRHRWLELGDELALLIVTVDVVAEMNGSVTRRPAGEIHPSHRDLAGDTDVDFLSLGDRGIDLAAAPTRSLLQHPGGKVARILDARAAGGLEAIVRAEELLVIGVVHVDRMRVRHVDAHGAER